MNIAEQLRQCSDLKLPAELHLGNGDTVICTKLIHIIKGRRVVLAGRKKTQPVLLKIMLDKRLAARKARREYKGHRILYALNIKTPALYFYGSCGGQPGLVFEFLHGQTLHDLWQNQPKRRAQIAKWGIDLFVKLHRNGCRHVDFHLGNFMVADDVFYVIDVGSIRKASRSIRMGTLLCAPKKYGDWQRHNLAKCFARFDPQTLATMMTALKHGYPDAASDPKLAPAITHAKKRRDKRLAKRNSRPGKIRSFFERINHLLSRK